MTVAIFTRASVTVADAIVIAVTLQKTHRQYREASRLGVPAGVGGTLLRHGE